MRKPKPRYVGEVRCDCGAVWEGRYALNNSIIDDHRQRERNGRQLGCRVVVIVEPQRIGASAGDEKP